MRAVLPGAKRVVPRVSRDDAETLVRVLARMLETRCAGGEELAISGVLARLRMRLEQARAGATSLPARGRSRGVRAAQD